MKQPDRLRFVHNFLVATSGITATIGFILLFWPEAILQWFIPGATGDFFIRFIGSALIGYAILNALAADTKQRHTQNIALWSNFTTLSIATGLSVFGVLSHAVTQLGWLLIGEHLVFVTGFGYSLWLEYKTPRE